MQFTIIAIIDLPSKRELRAIDLHKVYDHHLLIFRRLLHYASKGKTTK